MNSFLSALITIQGNKSKSKEADKNAEQKEEEEKNPQQQQVVEKVEKEKDLDSFITTLFEESDSNRDNVLTLNEFVTALDKHPTLLRFAELLKSTREKDLSTITYLVAIDFSDGAQRALEFVLRSLRNFDSLYLIYVHPPIDYTRKPPLMKKDAFTEDYQKLGLNKKKKLKRFVENLKSNAQKKGKQNKFKSVYCEGEINKTIIVKVEELQVDVLVLGSRGISPYHELLNTTVPRTAPEEILKPGNTALFCVTNAPCSVLLIK